MVGKERCRSEAKNLQRPIMALNLPDYEFVAPRKIVFGWGRRKELPELAGPLGRRAFVVCGSATLINCGAADELEGGLRAAGIETVRLPNIRREPEVADVDNAVSVLRDAGAGRNDFVLGLGGGSAIDLAKAAAALATNDHGATVKDFLEGVGRGLQLEREPLPVVAVPTTAGTGSEATKNAVISSDRDSDEPPFKKSLRADGMVPRLVVVDPELGVTAPPRVTAHSGMDAIVQLIESYLSRRARPIPQALCLQGLRLAAVALPEAVEDGRSRSAREAMAHAALLSGMALANSGLGMAHGVAAALGVHAHVPHGLACAVMLPAALRVNASVCPDEMLALAEIFTRHRHRDAREAADAVIDAVERLARRIGIPSRLSDLGVGAGQLDAVVSASRGNSMSGNPRDVPDQQLRGILEAML
jgi:alcohol dehydrogenase class IV